MGVSLIPLVFVLAGAAIVIVLSELLPLPRFVTFMASAIFGVVLLALVMSSRPQLIDVYRGNTELKITYEVCGTDTIAVDSMVVWRY